LDVALRLNPRDPWRYLTLMVKGSSLRILGRHDEAIAHCRQACQHPGISFLPYMLLAAALAAGGRKGEARTPLEKAIQLQPALSISFIRRNFAGAHESYLTSMFDSLRKVGVPE